MRCAELDGLLAGLVAGDLRPAQEEFLRLHLESCTRCQETVAALEATRRRLAALADDYRPDLSARIERAIARAHAVRQVGRWVKGAVRTAGVLAALCLVLLAVLYGPAARPAAEQPAPIYLVAGHELLAADLLQGTVRSVALPSGNLQLQPGGFLTDNAQFYALVDGRLRKLPLEGQALSVPGASDRGRREPVLLMRHGREVWAVRPAIAPAEGTMAAGDGYALDRIDLEIGEVDPGATTIPGTAYAAALSPDGTKAYVLTELEGTLFVKVIDTRTRKLVDAHRPTAGFGLLTELLPSPDGTTLHLVDRGRWLVVDLARRTILLDLEEPDVTLGAALNPDGRRLLSPLPEGGLALFDTRSGELLRKTEGRVYHRLYWKGGWIYAARADGIDLVDPVSLRVRASHNRSGVGFVYVP